MGILPWIPLGIQCHTALTSDVASFKFIVYNYLLSFFLYEIIDKVF